MSEINCCLERFYLLIFCILMYRAERKGSAISAMLYKAWPISMVDSMGSMGSMDIPRSKDTHPRGMDSLRAIHLRAMEDSLRAMLRLDTLRLDILLQPLLVTQLRNMALMALVDMVLVRAQTLRIFCSDVHCINVVSRVNFFLLFVAIPE